MSIRISDVKMPVSYERQALIKKCAHFLGVRESEIKQIELVRRSIDARKKPQLFYVCTLDIELKEGEKAEQRLLRRAAEQKGKCSVRKSPGEYKLPKAGDVLVSGILRGKVSRPVVVGTGPAGMACAYFLALSGLKPILIERGKAVEQRLQDVEAFWKTGKLLGNSNVQFGEGGAGTFSDGKLNTLIKDRDGRCRRILQLYVQMGAPEEILYDSKPHVGTDRLLVLCRNLRQEIVRLGGEIRFETVMEKLDLTDGKVSGIWVSSTRQEEGGRGLIQTRTVVLATGHSARDTFEALEQQGVKMEAKPFAVGLRVIHPQKMINENQYGRQPEEIYELLGAASYKLTAAAKKGRGVYSFCMCPGGYVVNASSEAGYLAVNGMSYSGRKGEYANSAIITTVTPEDFRAYGEGALCGMRFQRELEKRAFLLAGGRVPVQTLGEYRLRAGGSTKEPAAAKEAIDPGKAIKGLWEYADLTEVLEPELREAFLEGMQQFDKSIPGFGDGKALLCGIESRSSSPVRILRDETGQSEVRGLYPVGEGAGYAGGITSAAMDGLLAAERIIMQLNETAG